MNTKTDFKKLTKLAQLVRYFILVSTTEAGSGHPSSSLSAVELMTALMFGGSFRADLDRPDHPNNDRLIFSKGHASPLFYSLYGVAGKISEDELRQLRKFGSRLEGHPTLAFPYTEAATGSLGQGLSIGVGMALNAKYVDKLPYRTYVLLGDSEMAEGSVWEAIQSATHYKLDNLVGIIDVNRLGQRGQTMYGHDVKAYQQRISSFGWETIVVEGHSFVEIAAAYEKMLTVKDKPVMIIAKTIKGKGVSFIEDKDGWHGKALSKDELASALKELGEPDKLSRGVVSHPMDVRPVVYEAQKDGKISYPKEKVVATRRAYGNALVRIFPDFNNMVVLDGETSNSTYAEIFKKAHPERFFEMFIAEQNMAGVALGMSRRGHIPFCSTFSAFWTRAYDQIRMGQYSDANIKFVGSHAGASIGEDGSSQMGLEDISMFRSVSGSVVLYPSDAVSCEKLVEEAAKHKGMIYIRTTRKDTPILYENNENFPIGGSKVLRYSEKDPATIIGAGVTLHEALAAHEELKKEGIMTRVIDLYSVKPIDEQAIKRCALETKNIIVVEDHYPQGGLADAVRSVFEGEASPAIHSMSVRKMPKSGSPQEIMEYEEISKNAIIRKVREIVGSL